MKDAILMALASLTQEGTFNYLRPNMKTQQTHETGDQTLGRVSKHTPGPWAQDPTGDTGWYLIGTPNRPIATIEESDNYEQEQANARLIVSAPDLLSVCQAFADFSFTDYEARFNTAAALGRLVMLKRRARSIIAKT